MAQQSIFGRITQLAKANINALVDSAEDPQKMMDQMVRDYTDNISEAEEAVAQTIGNLRMMENDRAEAQSALQDWTNKAVAASKKADELRSSGDTSNADKFDNLAKVALQKQIEFEKQVKDMQPQVDSQTQIVDKLKDGLNQMRSKLEDLKNKRGELVGRAKMAEAQTKVQDAVKSVNIMDPTSDVSRFEDKIKREEAKVMGQAEIASSSLDAQFDALTDDAQHTEVEARLAALKTGSVPSQRDALTSDTSMPSTSGTSSTSGI